MEQQLGLHLDGLPGGIDPQALVDGLTALVKLANAVEDDEGQPSDWVMSDLHLGSVRCSIRPAAGQEAAGTRRIRVIWQGAQELRMRVGIPTGWNEHAVRVFLGLTKVNGCRGVESAVLSVGENASIILDDTIRQHAEHSLQGAAESLATVRGVIVRYVNDEGRREVRIRETSGGRSLRILFSSAMDHDVKIALLNDRQISVRGVLRRNGEGQKLALVAEHLIVLPASAQPPPRACDMVGVLGKDWTGDRDSVQWVRSQRG